MHRWACGVLVCLALTAGLSRAAAQAPSAFRYEVVSIKPAGDSVDWWGADDHADGVSIRNLTLSEMIVKAYGLIDVENAQVVLGGEKWVSTKKFDIEAKMAPEHIAAFQALNAKQKKEARQAMLQAVLAERFQLKARRETREFPVYALTVAKGGVQLKVYEEGKDAPGHLGPGNASIGPNFITGVAIPSSLIVGVLNAHFSGLERPVVDRTGLTGKYNVQLHWAPLGHEEGSSEPSLYAALEEQAGLHLEKTKAPLDVVLVEHAAEPQAD